MFILPSNDVFAFHLHLWFWLSSPFLSAWCECVCGGIHGARTEIQSHSLALSGNKMKSNEAYERYSVRATMPTTEWSSSLKRHYDPTRMIVKCILRVIWATAASSTQCSQNPIIKTVTNKNQQRQNIALRLWKCKTYVLVSRTRACHGQRQCHYSDCVQCVVHCVCCRKCILALFHCEIAFVWCVCVSACAPKTEQELTKWMEAERETRTQQ